MKAAGRCAHCKCEIYLPDALYNAALEGRESVSFYCGYGHSQHFMRGESDETKLRRENQRLMQQMARKDDELREQGERRAAAERQARAARGQVTKIKNRTARGVCPCCSRTFKQLAAHMAHKHPDFATLDSAAELVHT